MSLTSVSSRPPFSRTRVTFWCWFSVRSPWMPINNMSLKPMMAFSGVRKLVRHRRQEFALEAVGFLGPLAGDDQVLVGLGQHPVLFLDLHGGLAQHRDLVQETSRPCSSWERLRSGEIVTSK